MGSEDDVFDGGATGEVGGGMFEAEEDGAGDGGVGEILNGFVEDVAGVEVGGNQDVGMASDSGLSGFFGADARINGGVELHFAIDQDFWEFCSGDLHGLSDSVDGRILATGAEGGETEHGDFGLVV